MAVSSEQVTAIAAALAEAERTRAPIAPITDSHPDMAVSDAYAIQKLFVQHMMSGGAKVIGWKVGLTAVAVQKQLGVDSPDFGQLLDTMLVQDGATIDTSTMIWPRVEPEIAFVLKTPLKGPGVTVEDVLAATEALAPALEVVDSRVKDWKIKLGDTVSDNASCGRFVLGSRRTPPEGIDLPAETVKYFVNDEQTGTSTGAAVLGHPAAAVAWLANTLADLGQSLEAGQVIMPGSLLAMVDGKPGTSFRAEYENLGSVSVKMG